VLEEPFKGMHHSSHFFHHFSPLPLGGVAFVWRGILSHVGVGVGVGVVADGGEGEGRNNIFLSQTRFR